MALRLLRCNRGMGEVVILNPAFGRMKNLIISTEPSIEILPCLPAGRGYRLRMIIKQSLLEKGDVEFDTPIET